MKLSDFVARTVADHGISQVFMVTGGGAMHLNDSIGYGRGLTCVFTHHEQAAAMAADGYARVAGRPALVNVTTGPGAINALTGVYGAWTDSIPMLVVSGQVKRETLMATYDDLSGLRQLGDQEADVLAMVKGITKYSALVSDPTSIGYHLERALHLATTGRPGPCWLDIPIDVQAAQVDVDGLTGYDPQEDRQPSNFEELPHLCRDVLQRLRNAKRPVVLVGSGIHLAHAVQAFDAVIRRLGVPVATAWTAIDLMASDDPLYCGRPGTVGDRAGNFAVQNADVLLVIGCRLNIRQVSYNWRSFARCAYKIQVDADPAELRKPTVQPDLPIQCDAKVFLEELDRQLSGSPDESIRHHAWVSWCRERVARYPIVLPRHRVVRGRYINPYHFIDRLIQHLATDDVVVCGDGSACVMTFQVARVKKGQRIFTNSGCAAMGYDLPAAIGASVAREGRRVIGIAGDGSVQLNVQELQTLAHHRWPLKLFVLNNGGYLSMRLTQTNFFKRRVGEGPESGISFPNMAALAAAYGLPSRTIEGEDFEAAIRDALDSPGPMVVEVMLDPAQEFEPKLSSRVLPDGRIVSPALEDLAPFLDRDELRSNLLIPPLAE